MLSILGRASVSKVTAPVNKALLATGLTPDIMTVIGTVATIAAALTLFPMGYLFAGTLVIWLFVMFDMLDGAMARAHGGGTRFGGGPRRHLRPDRRRHPIFAGLAWWCMVEKPHQLLFVATLICLVTSQVISYAKARAGVGAVRRRRPHRTPGPADHRARRIGLPRPRYLVGRPRRHVAARRRRHHHRLPADAFDRFVARRPRPDRSRRRPTPRTSATARPTATATTRRAATPR